MLAKITRGNQVTIPKDIMKKAHLTESSLYVDVDYFNGTIMLKPVDVEERIPQEQLEKLGDWALKPEAGALSYRTLSAGIQHFKNKIKKKDL